MAPADLPRVPPPWRLRGSAYVFVFAFEPGALAGFLPPGLEGQLGAVMLVDYRESPVGPYRELLFLAGRNRRWRHHRFSITRIFVSTAASAVNGRENWGLPKQTAAFEVIRQADGAERVIGQTGGFARVDLTVAPAEGLTLPAASLFVPPSLRTIVQFPDSDGGRPLATRLSGRGVLRGARLLDFRTLPGAFPDVNRGEKLAAFRLDDFRLRLPRPVPA